VRDFDRNNRLAPRADAFEPIAVMVGAVVEMDPAFPNQRLDDLRIARPQRSVVVLQFRQGIASGHCYIRRETKILPSDPMNLLPF
jgi:hypothetical protein